MLGVPVAGWMCFFICGFMAGLLLSPIPFAPILSLAITEMVLALLGLVLVAIYTRSYVPREWRRWRVRLGHLLRGRFRLRHAAPRV
jgi:phosphatidylserine synthase